MKEFLKQGDILYPIVFWIIFIIWYLLFGSQLLSKVDLALDDVITNHSFWIFSPDPKEKDAITIVAIDQASRNHLNLKWPWPRSTTAEVIRKISSCSPKLIGLDIIFSGESEPREDKALIEALRSHPNIIAASIFQSDGIIRPSEKFENALKSIGFVNRPIEDGLVRSIIPSFQGIDQSQLLAIEFKLLQAYFEGNKDKNIEISANEIKFGKRRTIQLKNGLIPLNYLVYHSNFKTVPAYKILENQFNPNDFRDKIVLIGATDPIIHDRYNTVLGFFPGVAIIANGLVMLLSQRFITDLPLYQTLMYATILSSLIYLICRRKNLLISFLSLIAISAANFFFCIYLRRYDIRLSYFPLFSMPVVIFIAFNLYHYMSLIYVREKIKNKALFDDITGIYSTRYFKLLAKQKSAKTTALLLFGIKIANYEDLKQKFTFDQTKHLISKITSSLRNQSFITRNDPVAFVNPGLIIILKENPKTDHISLSLEGFISTVEQKKWNVDDRMTQVFLNGFLLNKPSGEKIINCDPVSQIDYLLKELGSDQKIYHGSLSSLKNNIDELNDGIHSDYDFIIYDWEEKAKELAYSLNALSEANTRLKRLNIGIIKTLARSIDAKSSWTAGHSERVTNIAVQIGKSMGIGEVEQNRLQMGGFLHDIGKIGIPSRILDKPGKLTNEEYNKICEHPAKGALILEPMEQLKDIIPLVGQHHERFDGKGYPQGLAGNKIHLGARIMAVADVFDALISKRPYRAGMPMEKAISIIEEGSGSQFDPEVVKAFFQFLANKEPPFAVIDAKTIHSG